MTFPSSNTEAALLAGIVVTLLIAAWFNQKAGDYWKMWNRTQSELEHIRRQRNAALCDRSYLVARVGDLSEGTLSREHAEDIADWMREWL